MVSAMRHDGTGSEMILGVNVSGQSLRWATLGGSHSECGNAGSGAGAPVLSSMAAFCGVVGGYGG